jgi:hypothetical protein
MAKLLVALAVGVVSCGADAAQNAPIHLVSAPKAITLGQTRTATLQTPKRAGRPSVTARRGRPRRACLRALRRVAPDGTVTTNSSDQALEVERRERAWLGEAPNGALPKPRSES